MWYLHQKWCNVPPLAIEAQDFPRLYWWVLNGAVGDSSISSQVFPGSIAMFYWRFQDQLHSQVGTDWNATARGGQQLFHREAVKRWCFWEGDPQFHIVEGKSAFVLIPYGSYHIFTIIDRELHPCPVGIPCRWMDLRFHKLRWNLEIQWTCWWDTFLVQKNLYVQTMYSIYTQYKESCTSW